MTGEWSAGKGSTYRPVNISKYGSNFDSIFRKNKLRHLFLDDTRWPRDVSWVNFDYTNIDWLIVRSYEQFVKALSDTDSFSIISFDHDLDQSASLECVRSITHKCDYNYNRVKLKTGKDCALYLKQVCDNGYPIPKYLVHTLNPQGANNIIEVLGTDNLIAQHIEGDMYNKSDEILGTLRKHK